MDPADSRSHQFREAQSQKHTKHEQIHVYVLVSGHWFTQWQLGHSLTARVVRAMWVLHYPLAIHLCFLTCGKTALGVDCPLHDCMSPQELLSVIAVTSKTGLGWRGTTGHCSRTGQLTPFWIEPFSFMSAARVFASDTQ